MYSFLSRLNTIFCFWCTVMSVLVVGNVLSGFVWPADPPPTTTLTFDKVHFLRQVTSKYPYPPLTGDQAHISWNLTVDLTGLWNWNTKCIYLFVVAEYTSSPEKRNEITLWDRILESPEESQFSELMTPEYDFIDIDSALRGSPAQLFVRWDVTHVSGLVGHIASTDHHGSVAFELPKEYI